MGMNKEDIFKEIVTLSVEDLEWLIDACANHLPSIPAPTEIEPETLCECGHPYSDHHFIDKSMVPIPIPDCTCGETCLCGKFRPKQP